MRVRAVLRVSVSQCDHMFLCLGRCERLCHSPRGCTPSTPSLRETSPHQPPHTRRPPRVTCDRGSRTSSSPRLGRQSDYGPEPRALFAPLDQPSTHPGPCVGAAALVPGEPFHEPPGDGSAWHQPRVPHLPSFQVHPPSWSDNLTESRGSSVSWKVSLSWEHENTQNSAQPPVSPNPSQPSRPDNDSIDESLHLVPPPTSCSGVQAGVFPLRSPAQAKRHHVAKPTERTDQISSPHENAARHTCDLPDTILEKTCTAQVAHLHGQARRIVTSPDT